MTDSLAPAAITGESVDTTEPIDSSTQSGGETMQDNEAGFQQFLASQNDPETLRQAIFKGNYTTEQKQKLLNRLNTLSGQMAQDEAARLKVEHENRLSLGSSEEEKDVSMEKIIKGNVDLVEEGLGYINEDRMSSFYDIGGNLQTSEDSLKAANQELKADAIKNATNLKNSNSIKELTSAITTLSAFSSDPVVKILLDELLERRDTLEVQEIEKNYRNINDITLLDAHLASLRVAYKSFDRRNINHSMKNDIEILIKKVETQRQNVVTGKVEV